MRTVKLFTIFCTVVASVAGFVSEGRAENTLKHLDLSEQIVDEVSPEKNEYATDPSYISVEGVDGALSTENRTMCSSFVTEVFKKSYGYTSTDMKNWTGSTSPYASTYHDVIEKQNGFTNILSIEGIAVGDLIAIKYLDGSSSTGHSAFVASAPVKRTSSSPVIGGTTQYDVLVIDSSKSGHGSLDSRLQADGSWDSGVGQGTMRLYVDSSGKIKGHTWSTSSSSSYYSMDTRHIVVGRLTKAPVSQ